MIAELRLIVVADELEAAVVCDRAEGVEPDLGPLLATPLPEGCRGGGRPLLSSPPPRESSSSLTRKEGSRPMSSVPGAGTTGSSG